MSELDQVRWSVILAATIDALIGVGLAVVLGVQAGTVFPVVAGGGLVLGVVLVAVCGYLARRKHAQRPRRGAPHKAEL